MTLQTPMDNLKREPELDIIYDITMADFEAKVVAASMEKPVIIDFWAPWCQPCKQLTPLLEAEIRAANGAVLLAKINIDENQELAQMMQVQSVPTIYAIYQGQPIDGFTGAKPASEISAFIESVIAKTGGNSEASDNAAAIKDALEKAEESLVSGDAEPALTLFTQIFAEDPTQNIALAGMIRAQTALHQYEHAHSLVEGLDDEVLKDETIKSAISALKLSESASKASQNIAEFEKRLAENKDDNEARYELAQALLHNGDNEAGIDHLCEIVKNDNDWREGAARLSILEWIDSWGQNHPDVVKARRKLSSVLFS